MRQNEQGPTYFTEKMQKFCEYFLKRNCQISQKSNEQQYQI